MNQIKILIAGCNSHILSTKIKEDIESLGNYKVNTIGSLDNLSISMALDKPNVVLIHFHVFTHNALEISQEIYDNYGVPSIFMVDSEAFREPVELMESAHILGCITSKFPIQEIQNILKTHL